MAVTTSLFVKGLSKGCNERHIVSVFSQFGAIVDCQIARHRSGRSAGFAIVTFADQASAAKALQITDTSVLFGRPLSVRWYSAERSLDKQGMSIEQQQQLASMLQGTSNDVLLQQLAERAAWTSAVHAAGSNGGASLANDEQVAGAAANWMNMNNWLSFVDGSNSEDAATQLPTVPAAAALRRSFDGSTPSASGSRRRTTQASHASLSLEGLDLSGMASGAPSEASGSMGGAPPPATVVEDPGSFGKSRLITKWGVHTQQHGSSSGGAPCAAPMFGHQDPISMLTCSSCLSEGGSGSSSTSSRDISDELALNLVSMNLSDSILSTLDESLLLDGSTPRATTTSLPLTQRSSLPLLPSAAAMDAFIAPAPRQAPHPRAASSGMVRTAPATPNKVMPGAGPHSHSHMLAPSSLSFDLGTATGHHGSLAGPVPSGSMPGMALHLQAAVKQQVHQLSAAQQQYASALAQLQAARTQILAAAAALQGQPPAGPFGGAAAPGMAPMLHPRTGMHVPHPGLASVGSGGMDLGALMAMGQMGGMY
mmetsp:Transcript_28721/g.73044  ORF Transcript_28721/g.73044 Transcript_28721/m.73044 type:complete len:537 (-) Transcript_28721:1021-2631(-)|eukprot:CAMPEP_0202871256 /NCGR_PEP_ID=MMETSP1391-20130828/18207_1 /ASSEMBLY_ACC=CAM_ASM_000867 /TAXON_ID=1034604 /ORGANISM="Chlamydomonas leiostraca, Strain SAG 11-49" /LENGTH=536 /DNA_ID=CAMNT_0049551999 /DNA_START=49 /DNA_END=1659 /DNA_ORIENTATION=-